MRGTDRKMGRAATQGRAATALPACGKTGRPYGFMAARVVLAAMIGTFGMLAVAAVTSIVRPERAEAIEYFKAYPLKVLYGDVLFAQHPDSTVPAARQYAIAGQAAVVCTLYTPKINGDVVSLSVSYAPDSLCDSALTVYGMSLRFGRYVPIPINSFGDTLWPALTKYSDSQWGGMYAYPKASGPYLILRIRNPNAATAYDSAQSVTVTAW